MNLRQRYYQLARQIEQEFERNRALHGSKIHCTRGCTDCCHQLFLITAQDAVEIARAVERLSAEVRGELEARARQWIERALMRGQRTACPALVDGACSIYESRPLICRRFGMPIYNPDKPDRILACPLNFSDGEEIRDPELIQIQTEIHQCWGQLQRDFSSAHPELPSGRLSVAQAILEAPSYLSCGGDEGG